METDATSQLYNIDLSFLIVIAETYQRLANLVIAKTYQFFYIFQAPIPKRKKGGGKRKPKPFKTKDNEHLGDILQDYSEAKK